MLKGILAKVKGGFYFVMDPQGRVVRCRARGRLKEKGVHLLVGDRVKITRRPSDEGIIETVLPRRNSLSRPPIANVDQVVIVVSLSEPLLDLNLLHRIIISAEAAGLVSVLCFNKMDLVVSAAEHCRFAGFKSVFNDCGYTVVSTSSVTGEGLTQLQGQLRGRTSVLAGPSGTGKSTLLNKIRPDLDLKSAAISPKLRRGRHTTRHVELINLERDTLVADTPGFQRLGLVRMPPQKLASLFPEMAVRAGDCRFSSCLHDREPACAVKEAVEKEEIAAWRYNLYISFLEEIRRQEDPY